MSSSEARAQLSRRTTRGAGVTLMSQGARFVLQLVGLAVLSRILSPSQVGLVAMVTAILNAAEIVRDFGLSSAAIQAPTLSRSQRDNLFWMNLAIGSSCSLLAIGLAPLIAFLYGRPELLHIALALSGLFVISGANTQYRADLSRNLRFTALAVTDVLAQLCSVAAGVASAILGAGYWAIVIQQLTLSSTTLASNALLCRWRPRRPDRSVPMGGFLRFGSHVLGTNLLGFAVNNVDNIGVGAAWGPAALGTYTRAYQLLQQPLQQLTAPLSRVVLPVLARSQTTDAEYTRVFGRIQSAVCLGLGLTFALLAGTAQPVTAVLLGSSWHGVAPVLAVLALGGIFKSMDAISYQLWISRNLTQQLLRYYLVSRPLMIVVILAGLPWGPLGVAVGHLVAAVANWMIGTRLACRYAGLPARAIITTPGMVLVLVIAPAAGVSFAGSLLPVAPILQVSVGVAAGASFAAAVCLLVPQLRRDLSPLIKAMHSAVGR